MKLALDKATQILNIITPFIENKVILPRDYQAINDDIDNFITIQKDDKIIACTGIKKHKNINQLYCFAVDEKFQKQGIATELLNKIIQQFNNKPLLALSKYTEAWFLKKGFVELSIDELPSEIEYDYKRSSKIFVKNN